MINSRSKGKRGELEVRDLLRQHGFEAKRGQQHAGGGDSPDVMHNMTGIHIEVKLVNALNLSKAMIQARRDAKPGDTPVVFHRRDREDWMVTMPASYWLAAENELREGGSDGCNNETPNE